MEKINYANIKGNFLNGYINTKVDSREKHYQSQRGTLYHDKRVSLPRRRIIPKCECTRYKDVKFMEQKTGGIERKNREMHIIVGNLNTPLNN